ncbi:magnesium transporter [Planctomycetota bacterium]
MAEDQDKTRRQILLQQVELLLEDRNLYALRSLLTDQWESDIAEIVESVDNEKRRLIFDALELDTAAEVIEKVNEATRDEVFDLLRDSEIKAIFTELDPDDAADLLAEMPAAEAHEVLQSLDHEDRQEIHELMQYSEDSAGGIMDPAVISVGKNATVAEAIGKIRAQEIDEDFYAVFVVDDHGKYVGDVRLRLLLTKPEQTRIKSIVDTDPLYVYVDTDQEEVRNLFSKHDLITIPVVDRDDRLVGRITADRVIEVAEEEAAEDVFTMAGTNPDELDTFSAFNAARIRLTWIVPCLLGTAVTLLVSIYFKGLFNEGIFAAVLVFVPMVAAISGNAGLQTSAIVVSGLATGHLAALRLGQVFSREVRIALIVALSCAVIGGAICAVSGQIPVMKDSKIDILRLAFALGTAMFSAIMVATTLGLFLPFLFRQVGIDPAISSGPIVTTANDSISVAIYLTLALQLAGG